MDEASFGEARVGKIAQRELLIRAWQARDQLYRNLFGNYHRVSPTSYAPPPPLSLADLKVEDDLQGWKDTANPGDPAPDSQQLAILTYSPDPLRPYWLYITAGLCSPWLQEQPDEVSGFGCELMIKSPVEADWPAQILRSMAFYIFNHAGTLSPGARISLNGPIVPNSESRLKNVLIWYPDEAPDCWYQLPSGGFGIFIAIGITDDELKFAESIEEHGTWCVQQILRQIGFAQVTDPNRVSAMQHENIASIINSVKNYARQF